MEAVDKLFPKVNGQSAAFRLFYVAVGLDDFVLEYSAAYYAQNCHAYMLIPGLLNHFLIRKANNS